MLGPSCSARAPALPARPIGALCLAATSVRAPGWLPAAPRRAHRRTAAAAAGPDGGAGASDAAPAAPSPTSSQDGGAGGGGAGGQQPPMPKRGFFSIADPNAEVYSKAGDKFDPAKKPDRYKPEFIWNTNWQEQLKLQEDLERQRREYLNRQKEGATVAGSVEAKGVVSFSRLSALDDMSVDLTEQLRRAKERDEQRKRQQELLQQEQQQQQQQGGAAAGPAPAAAPRPAAGRPRGSGGPASPSYQFKDLPSRGEARRFARATRIASSGVSVDSVGTLPPEEAARRAAEAEEGRLRYEALKVEFQLWTLAAGALGAATTYFLYSKDVSASYTVGALGGMVYLRLLGRSVDSVGGGGGGLGQPRLLIPVILVLVFNRWNQVYADNYGLTLQLIPMLLGFFTYKLAVIGRQGLQELSSFSVVERKSDGGDDAGGAAGAAAGAEASGEAMSLDRIFVKRVTREW